MQLGAIVRGVAATGEEAIITDSGSEVAVIISMADYERLHEHADLLWGPRPEAEQANKDSFSMMAAMIAASESETS